MKKLILVLLAIVVLFTLYGCASEQQPQGEPDIEGVMFFDFDHLTFHIDSDWDLLYDLPHMSEDLLILRSYVLDRALTDNEINSYKHLLESIDFYTTSTSVLIKTVLSYDAATFKDALESVQRDVTLDDIVVFNELKVFISEFNESPAMYKIDYLNRRLDSPLSASDISALSELQYAYVELKDIDESYRLFDHPLSSMIEALESYGWSFTPSHVDTLTRAYDLIDQLHETESSTSLVELFFIVKLFGNLCS